MLTRVIAHVFDITMRIVFLILALYFIASQPVWGQSPCQDPVVPPPQVDPNGLWAGSDKTLYAVNETITFRVRSNVSGPCEYRIQKDRYLPVLASGTLDLIAGEEQTVTFQYPDPNFLMFYVSQGGNNADAGVAIEACDIQPTAYLPGDFDQFWDSLKTELAAVPVNPQVTLRPDLSNQSQTTYKMVLDNIDGKQVHGWISIPTCDGPFGAVLTLPSFGSGGIGPSDFDAFEGIIGVSISIHDFDPEQNVPDSIAYAPADHYYDRETNYYKAGILGAVRAIDYVFTRPEFDGVHMAVTGVSQGGGLSLMVAGIDERVKYVAQGVTALCNHAAYASGESSGFPYWVRAGQQAGGDVNQIIEATGYYDAVNFARKYKGPSYNFVGYNDEICPPASVFAAYNQMIGDKTMFHSINTGHANPPNFWPDRLAFWMEHIPFSKFFAGCPPVPGPDVIAPDTVKQLVLEEATTNSLSFSFLSTGDDLDDGTAYCYEMRFDTKPIDENNFDDAPAVDVQIFPLPSGSQQFYRFDGLLPGAGYCFAIRAVDEAGNKGPVAVICEQTLVMVNTCLDDGIVFSNQQQIDDFPLNYPNCTEILGPVTVEEQSPGSILNLQGLSQVEAIYGFLQVSNNATLGNFGGLDNLHLVGSDLLIIQNESLTEITALLGLSEINGNFEIIGNPVLGSLRGLDSIRHVSGWVTIQDNDALLNFDGFGYLDSIGGNLVIQDLRGVQNFIGLGNLKRVGGNLEIRENLFLTNIEALSNLNYIGGDVHIQSNYRLKNLTGFQGIDKIYGNLELVGNDLMTDVGGLENLEVVDGYVALMLNLVLEDVSALSNLQSIGGSLRFWANDALKIVSGFENLTHIGGGLSINNHAELSEIASFDQLDSIGGTLELTYNPALTSLTGLSNLKALNEDLVIGYNASLHDLSGLEGLATVPGWVYITENDTLTNLEGLNNLTHIGYRLEISSNKNLTSVQGLESLQTVDSLILIKNNGSLINLSGLEGFDHTELEALVVSNNPWLSDCAVTSICNFLSGSPNKPATIFGNATGCNSRTEVETACGIVSTSTTASVETLKIFPNPASSRLQLMGIDEGLISFFNSMGALVKTEVFTGEAIDLSGMPGGVYWVQVQTGDRLLSGKLVVE